MQRREKCSKVVQGIFFWLRNAHDEDRSGRPSHSDATVQKVKELMHQNRRVTLDDMAINLEGMCSRNSIHIILTDVLKYRVAFIMTMRVHMCPNRQQHSSRNLVRM